MKCEKMRSTCGSRVIALLLRCHLRATRRFGAQFPKKIEYYHCPHASTERVATECSDRPASLWYDGPGVMRASTGGSHATLPPAVGERDIARERPGRLHPFARERPAEGAETLRLGLSPGLSLGL